MFVSVQNRDVAKNFISPVIINYRRVAGFAASDFLAPLRGHALPENFENQRLKMHFWYFRDHIRL